MAFRDSELSRRLRKYLHGNNRRLVAVEIRLVSRLFIVSVKVKLLLQIETGSELHLREALLSGSWA